MLTNEKLSTQDVEEADVGYAGLVRLRVRPEVQGARVGWASTSFIVYKATPEIVQTGSLPEIRGKGGKR